jgi:hypothetical protein
MPKTVTNLEKNTVKPTPQTNNRQILGKYKKPVPKARQKLNKPMTKPVVR